MKFYTLGHLTDDVLLNRLKAAALHECGSTAVAVAHIAEVEARQLYCKAGHFFHAQLLRPEIEEQLARRFPSTELLPLVEAEPAAAAPPESQLDPQPVVSPVSCQLAPARARLTTSRIEPIAEKRSALHLSMSERLSDKIRHAQDLLSHRIPSGDLEQVIELGMDALIRLLEKGKSSATDQPRPPKASSSANSRHIPAHVRRAVAQRNGYQCMFVTESGRRCSARRFLEFDHILEVARGGKATLENIRLLCRAHNQYQAGRTFGSEFMRSKREDARRAAAERRQAPAQERARQIAQEQTDDIVKGLRNLGFRADDARRAAESSASLPNASLETRMRAALSYFRPRARAAPA